MSRPAVTAVPARGVPTVLKQAPVSAWFGLAVIAVYLIVAGLAPLLAPFGESAVIGNQFEPWSAPFLLGTDSLGRDMLSRLIYGARNSIAIALAATSLSFVVGCTLGLLASVLGRAVDQLMSRIVDIMIAIPHLVFTLVLLTIFGSSTLNLILIIALLDATRIFRLTRAVAMDVVVLDFVEAARLQGSGFLWIMFREILPNITAPLIAEFGLRFCFVFLTISALSFLGLGLQPPTADLGSMVRETSMLITYGDVTPLLPAGVIALLTVAVNFVVDWVLQGAGDPREEA